MIYLLFLLVTTGNELKIFEDTRFILAAIIAVLIVICAASIGPCILLRRAYEGGNWGNFGNFGFRIPVPDYFSRYY